MSGERATKTLGTRICLQSKSGQNDAALLTACFLTFCRKMDSLSSDGPCISIFFSIRLLISRFTLLSRSFSRFSREAVAFELAISSKSRTCLLCLSISCGSSCCTRCFLALASSRIFVSSS